MDNLNTSSLLRKNIIVKYFSDGYISESYNGFIIEIEKLDNEFKIHITDENHGYIVKSVSPHIMKDLVDKKNYEYYDEFKKFYYLIN